MKLPVPFIQLPLRFDAAALAAEISVLEESLWRSHPSGLPGNTALPLVTVEGDPLLGDALSGPMRPTPALERCPYVHQVLASLGAVVGRVRLMRLSGGAEVKPHVDTNHYWHERVRVHIPILTNASVQFFCGDAQVHMAAGECWIFDTWRLHRVLNNADAIRVHLVVDTIGSSSFGNMVRAGRSHTAATAGWECRLVQPGEIVQEPLYESVNLMSPMSYWELREMIAFLLSEAEPHPQLQAVAQIANGFVLDWRTLWFSYGSDQERLSDYRRLLVDFLASVRRIAMGVRLRNSAQFAGALVALLGRAVQDEAASASDEYEQPNDAEPSTAFSTSRQQAGFRIARTASDEFDRPIFIVSPPRSGSSLLFETLALGPSVCTIGGESHGVIEGGTPPSGLGAAARGYDSNRLEAIDASPAVVQMVRERFRKRALDRQGQKRAGYIRLLEKTPKNALRIPFLAKIFPDAIFVYLHRDPRQVLASMMEAWESGRFRTYPNLPGWTGLPWSMVLTPGWRELIGKSLPEIVAGQWQTTTRILLDDLEALPSTQWCALRYEALLAAPQSEIERLCENLGLEWDHPLQRVLPVASHTVSKPSPEKWRLREREVELAMIAVTAIAERATRVMGQGLEPALT